jgi:hypothetical protein
VWVLTPIAFQALMVTMRGGQAVDALLGFTDRPGVLIVERTRVDRLVARVAVQPLDDLAGLLVTAPQVARGHARLAEPAEEHREVDVEGLRGGTVRPGLHVLRVRGVTVGWFRAHDVRGVDDGLALDPAHLAQGIGDRAARHGQQHCLDGGDVAAVPAEPRHLMTGPLPQIPEAAADVPPSIDRDPHFSAPRGWLGPPPILPRRRRRKTAPADPPGFQ